MQCSFMGFTITQEIIFIIKLKIEEKLILEINTKILENNKL